MKKTLFSLATVTAITGVATGNAEAGGYSEGQDNTVNNTEQAAVSSVSNYESHSYSYDENGYTYSYGSQASEETAAETSYEAPAVQEEAPAVQEYDAPAAPAPQAPAPVDEAISSAANYYAYGDCTWHVFERLSEMGKSVSSSFGNASNWDNAAWGAGMTVDNSPSVGAIMQLDPGQGGAGSMGHVAVVEAVNTDGSIQISEMNWNGGMGVESNRTVSAAEVSSYDFIH